LKYKFSKDLMPKGAENQCIGEDIKAGSVLPFGNSRNMKVVGLQKLEAYQDQNMGSCDDIDVKSSEASVGGKASHLNCN
jgi:hypothetical protein